MEIDSGYRGEVEFRYKIVTNGRNITPQTKYGIYNINDRVGQIIILPIPYIEFQEVDELSDTIRGEGGFGSSGL